ncbi:hypothetical protein [Aldersonia kunmingensis]|uniref:hypothetical protein n=1 Tax=Aldersonia kunmingensis TaxID=408066 RepID=UPI00083714F9|nr:hypothetical protein [Aldersonia kunmingensis]
MERIHPTATGEKLDLGKTRTELEEIMVAGKAHKQGYDLYRFSEFEQKEFGFQRYMLRHKASRGENMLYPWGASGWMYSNVEVDDTLAEVENRIDEYNRVIRVRQSELLT